MPKSSGRYHHGDLRAALLSEAIASLDRDPEADITLRGLAKAVGVSPMAPYAHFDDKGALMDAIAIEGFASLEEALKAATAEMRETIVPKLQLMALAKTYVTYGVAHPGMYRVMFQRPAQSEGHPVRDAGEKAFQPLTDFFANRGVDARQSAEIAWSFVHGLTLLVGVGFVDTEQVFEVHIKAACEAFVHSDV